MIIRASEIGTYLFCQRAWWYRHHGYTPENQDELSNGSQLHYRHRQAVLVASLLRMVAYSLLLAALVLAIIYIMR